MKTNFTTELTCTPQKPIHRNLSDLGFEFGHIRLIVPWLHVQDYVGLSNKGRFWNRNITVKKKKTFQWNNWLLTCLPCDSSKTKMYKLHTSKESRSQKSPNFSLHQPRPEEHSLLDFLSAYCLRRSSLSFWASSSSSSSSDPKRSISSSSSSSSFFCFSIFLLSTCS